jgi:hypothetical protein
MASEKAKDVELAKKLWDLSVELTTWRTLLVSCERWYDGRKMIQYCNVDTSLKLYRNDGEAEGLVYELLYRWRKHTHGLWIALCCCTKVVSEFYLVRLLRLLGVLFDTRYWSRWQSVL